MHLSEKTKKQFSEQDTADKLILPYLSREFGYPKAESMDYQAQHTVSTGDSGSGRYDGLYLSRGYPYIILEAKKYSHDIVQEDFAQARDYAVSVFFDEAVPFIILSNGRDHRFFRKTDEIDPSDSKIVYKQIPPLRWKEALNELPGKVRIQLTPNQLLERLQSIRDRVFNDINSYFWDEGENKYSLVKTPYLKDYLEKIIDSRKTYIGDSISDTKRLIKHSIQSIALHFTIKVLFIKIVEDLSAGSETPRIIHDLFPDRTYNEVGGVFGCKLLNGLSDSSRVEIEKFINESKQYYSNLGQDLSKITFEDIFRYGFDYHRNQYGKLLKARNYDRFFPREETLHDIRKELIEIDTRNALIYASEETRKNVIGDIYAKLIDESLRAAIGAVYTPDDTVEFMVSLGKAFLGSFKGKRILEDACGSGHFYKLIYRMYVDEVLSDMESHGQEKDYFLAHKEALYHIYGRDIDPFAVQLTLLGVFLEQLRDGVKPSSLINTEMQIWLANKFVDCQNSLDPITIDPDRYFDVAQTADLEDPKSLLEACKASLNPDLIISNPPYGVKVVTGMQYDQVYDLQSDDSYGYFIYNAILRLLEGRRLIFIISSSFLTIKSHFKLRKFILENAKIIRIIKLHRATFPGIDIFPVIIELEKAADISSRENNYYQFYDLWQLHPVRHKEELRKVYQFILSDLSATSKWTFDNKNIAHYVNRQGIINSNKNSPFFDGSPSLFEFMNNVSNTNKIKLPLKNLQGIEQEFSCKEIRGTRIIPLGNDYDGNEFGTAKQGLIPPSVREYYRICPGVKGGAVKGGYIEVNLAQTLTIDDIEKLSHHDRRDGIEVNDLSRDKFYVALDKAGAADIEGKILKKYYSPVEYYVNWSKSAVLAMRGDPKGRFQNSNFYFQRGISYSDTGIYSPTFRMSFGGVFDQKASVIFNGYFSLYYLLGVLNSKLIKYFVKVFINHSVSAQVDSIKEIPIVVPSDQQRSHIEKKVSEIIDIQRVNPNYDYYNDQKEIDDLVYQLYNLTEDEIIEVEDWYDRKYPKLRRDIDTTNLEES